VYHMERLLESQEVSASNYQGAPWPNPDSTID
jgi:hypothetical protein